jgi:hypothetical protein
MIRRKPRYVAPLKSDAAPGRTDMPREQIEDGGLARAVRPDDAQDFPGMKPQTVSVYCVQSFERLGETVNFEKVL